MMKSNLLLKSGFTFLMLAGTLAPVSSFGFDGDLYNRLSAAHSEQQWSTGTEFGAQGPIREEGMATTARFSGEGDMYDRLAYGQFHERTGTAYGAEGPIRTESMENYRSGGNGEGDMFDVLRLDAGH